MASDFTAELGARVAALQAEVERALAGWEQERRSRWEAVRARVRALTFHTAAAQDEARARLVTTPAPRRAQVPEIFRWISRFDRDRARVEQEIWALLRAARAEDERWRARVTAHAAALAALGGRLRREAEAAVGEAAAAGTMRVLDTAAGRALQAQLAAASATMAERLAAWRERVAADLAAMGGGSFPDPAGTLERFEAAMAGRLAGAPGGAPAGVAAARAARPARPAKRPDRKKARVPQFLLKRFYKPGSLRAGPAGVEITFVNPLGFCIIQGGDAVLVDGHPFPKEQTVLDNGEKRVGGHELSVTSYLKFAKGGEIRVSLQGLALPSGAHRVQCALELRKMGWVDLDVRDNL
jgi:hypothetical protein